MDNKDTIIRDAQYRKGLSIAFFNATNAAIELAKIFNLQGVDAKKFIVEWRDFFLSEHHSYYANVIARVGLTYKPEDAMKRLGEASTVEDLKFVWLTLSEDERRDETICAFMKGQKSKLTPKPTK